MHGVSVRLQQLDEEIFSELQKKLYDAIVKPLWPLKDALDNSVETLSVFEKAMQDKKDKQYGPPQRRTNMRHRHHR